MDDKIDIEGLKEAFKDDPNAIFVGNLSDFFSALESGGQIAAQPRSGLCMLCGKPLVKGTDIDHSVCNKCWTDTFACKVCGDESGECEHQNES